ncbi:ester cyclase [Pseudonocardia bannensis]|uniref:Ester cyclase n=1 Tax=Pseudonocardia bannensis TaxID=630973 RepID=A0A848DH64_9PSEU|nr:ester cyclase [Pseudonocardia bannensis]NMH91997.1 ester cyclase [Pseudonocardia bannensis]
MSLADRLYQAYRSRDINRVSDLYAPGGWHREVATGRVSRGREAIGRGLQSFLEAFPDARWEAEAIIVDDSREAVPYRLTGTLSKRLGGFQPRGQILDLRGVHVLGSIDDQIAWSEDYWDAETFRRQMSGA